MPYFEVLMTLWPSLQIPNFSNRNNAIIDHSGLSSLLDLCMISTISAPDMEIQCAGFDNIFDE
jgi:hypothetical protein